MPAEAWLSIGTSVAVMDIVETRGASYGLLAGGEGAVFASHLVPVDAPPEVLADLARQHHLPVPPPRTQLPGIDLIMAADALGDALYGRPGRVGFFPKVGFDGIQGQRPGRDGLGGLD